MLHIPYESKIGLVQDDDVPPPAGGGTEFFHEMVQRDRDYIDESITYIHPRLPTLKEIVECSREVALDAKIDEIKRTYMARAQKKTDPKPPKPAPADTKVGEIITSQTKTVIEAASEDFPVNFDIQSSDEIEMDASVEDIPSDAEFDDIENDEEIKELERELEAAINMPADERKVRERALQAIRQRRWKEKSGRLKKPKGASGTCIVDGMEYLHVVVRTSLNSSLYLQGADIGPKHTLTEAPFGNTAKSNVYERMMSLQRHLNVRNATPKWIIITRDDVTVLDPYFRERLKSVTSDNTVCVGAFGTKEMRVSGRWWEQVKSEEFVGQCIQGDPCNPLVMSQFVAPGYDDERFVNGFRAACVTSGMLAVRGSFFRSINFESIASTSAVGYFHFIPMICMEANKAKKVVGVVRTLMRQEDKVTNHKNEESLQVDHRAFIREYFRLLPISIK